MSNYLNENLIVDPRYRTQRVTLASSAAAVKRGQVIGVNSDGDEFAPVDASHTAYGVCLDALEALDNAAARPVNVLVEGEVASSMLYGISEAAITDAIAVALRNVGIICK